MGNTRMNDVKDEKGQERQEERAIKEGRARNGGRQDKTTVKKGQEQDEETCTNMKKGQERARRKGGQEGRRGKKDGGARRTEGQEGRKGKKEGRARRKEGQGRKEL